MKNGWQTKTLLQDFNKSGPRESQTGKVSGKYVIKLGAAGWMVLSLTPPRKMRFSDFRGWRKPAGALYADCVSGLWKILGK